MNSELKQVYLLKILIIASVISTLIHNIDNYLRFDLYPQPAWITPAGIFRSWVTWTILGFTLWSGLVCKSRRETYLPVFESQRRKS